MIQKLYQIEAIKFGNFTLKSGLTSQIYLDLRKIISFPQVLNTVADLMWEKISGLQFDLICGVPYTALPIATCLSLKYNVPMIMRRKEVKNHGTKQKVEGCYLPGQTCLIVEDVITTGSSILETAADLNEVGIHTTNTVVLINRESGGEQNLNKINCQLHSVFYLKDVLRTLNTEKQVSKPEREIITNLLSEL